MDRVIKAGLGRWPVVLTLGFVALFCAVPAHAAAPEPSVPLAPPALDLDQIAAQGRLLLQKGLAWYQSTPPAERVTWGGLAAAAALGLSVMLSRSLRLRQSRIIPQEFATRFLERLHDGRLDRGKAQDYCELNSSPAARIALAAVKRWGRPVADLERAVALAHRVEAERIRAHVGTLRRIAALAPLIGLLGTLTSLSRTLASLGHMPNATANLWGPALATALWPITAGVALATVALVVYDGLIGKVEHLTDALDRIGAETIDAVALAAPLTGGITSTSSAPETRPAASGPAQSHGPHPHHPSSRGSHPVRLEIPRPSSSRMPIDDDDLD